MVDATKLLHGRSQGLSLHSLEIFGFPKLKSFAQELEELGISQRAIKRICKQVVLKTLEAHGAMIRSYCLVLLMAPRASAMHTHCATHTLHSSVAFPARYEAWRI